MNRWLIVSATVLFAAVPLLARDKAEEMAKYVQELKSLDSQKRARAAEEIGKIAQVKASLGKTAVQPIKDALGDKASGVRAAAALALGKLDQPEVAVPALTELLKKEKETSVKIAAAQGLGLMGEAAKGALPTLREVREQAKKDENMRLAQTAGAAMQRISGRMKKE